MKKILILAPFFVLAACIDIDISVGEKANASVGKTPLGESGSMDGTRLSRKYMIGSDDSKMETKFWHDNELGLNCSFQTLSDKNVYCLPDHINGNYYSDAECTKPVYVEAYTKGNFACHTFHDYVRFGHDYATACGQVDLNLTMHRIKKTNIIYQGNAIVWYEKDSTKACNKKTVDVPGIEVAIFGVTEIGDESKFVKIVEGAEFGPVE
jgi:hypothetical protein